MALLRDSWPSVQGMEWGGGRPSDGLLHPLVHPFSHLASSIPGSVRGESSDPGSARSPSLRSKNRAALGLNVNVAIFICRKCYILMS